MGEITKSSSGKSSSNQEVPRAIVPKPEFSNLELLSESPSSVRLRDNIASSSGSNVRSILLGMGFLQSLVDRAIQEKGGEDVVLLLDTLLESSARQKSNSESSNSLDSLFDEENGIGPLEVSNSQPKEELDVLHGINNDKRESLLMMNFSVTEVNFAMDHLGKDAPISQLVEFIVASQIAVKFEKEDDITHSDQGKYEEKNNETLFKTMEKTLGLLQMGFSEDQVSAVIERYASELPVSELAELIITNQLDGTCSEIKCISTTSRMIQRNNLDGNSFRQDVDIGLRCSLDNLAAVKREDSSLHTVPQPRSIGRDEIYRGKRSKQEDTDTYPGAVSRVGNVQKRRAEKRPKQEHRDDWNSVSDITSVEEKVDSIATRPGTPRPTGNCRTLDQMVAKRPYFFYGSVATLSHELWEKISQFLYGIEPEYVNTQFFSALSRKEGYVHNLPTANRFHILPKPPMTIQEAMPYTKKWWPSWDTRKQLSCISSETSGISHVCDRRGRILADSQGFLSPEQQRDILHHCRTKNLVWVGRQKVAFIEPEHLESSLGYPLNHTEAAGSGLDGRLQLLKNCFQTDTLGYHLSVLKSMFPEGITMLSIYSGIGGAAIALHRLGIRLRGVVSVETSETQQRIFRGWWNSTEQVGELVQIDEIQKLAGTRLENLIEQFGGFDFVICQNPCSQPSKSQIAADGDNFSGFDFKLFYEFVRVLQRVRDTMERRQ